MSRTYRNKLEYIEAIKTVLGAREDFKDLTYNRATTGEEYLFLSAVTGEVFMFDITGMKNEQIFHMVAMIECGLKPECQIEDRAKRLEIGKMFN
jgi:hypothetical protein